MRIFLFFHLNGNNVIRIGTRQDRYVSMREFSNHAVLSMSDSTMAVSSKYTQDLSVQIVFFTLACKWFLCSYFWAVIWSYIVDLFASSVRALLKPYGDTLSENRGTLFAAIFFSFQIAAYGLAVKIPGFSPRRTKFDSWVC